MFKNVLIDVITTDENLLQKILEDLIFCIHTELKKFRKNNNCEYNDSLFMELYFKNKKDIYNNIIKKFKGKGYVDLSDEQIITAIDILMIETLPMDKFQNNLYSKKTSYNYTKEISDILFKEKNRLNMNAKEFVSFIKTDSMQRKLSEDYNYNMNEYEVYKGYQDAIKNIEMLYDEELKQSQYKQQKQYKPINQQKKKEKRTLFGFSIPVALLGIFIGLCEGLSDNKKR